MKTNIQWKFDKHVDRASQLTKNEPVQLNSSFN